MKNNRNGKKHHIKRHIPHNIITLTLVLLLIVLAFSSIKLYKKQIANKKEIKVLESELKEEKERLSESN